MRKWVIDFLKNTGGSPAAEYSLIAGLIAVIAILSFGKVGEKAGDNMDTVSQSLQAQADNSDDLGHGGGKGKGKKK